MALLIKLIFMHTYMVVELSVAEVELVEEVEDVLLVVPVLFVEEVVPVV
jgi:hypothetical protein